MATYHFSNNPHPTVRGTNTKINTVTHYRYITREGSYSHGNGREDDLLHISHGNMPDWASSPKDFWKAAEENRRANGRAYREIRMALPEELSLEENIKLVESFLDQSGIRDKHAYTYVIHDKVAAFDEDHRNIHCHLMFNEREIEKDRPLATPEEFFSRYSPKLGNRETGEGAGEVSGGYRVSTVYSDRNTTLRLRKDWENIVNAGLARNGFSERVSCETLEKQREQLEKAGKHKEAEILNRPPAPRLNFGYKHPFVMKKIRARIEHYKEALEKGTDEISNEDNIIDLFAHDVALRQRARELQRDRTMAIKANKDIADQEYQDSFRDDPMVVTIGDLKTSFRSIQEKMLKDTEELTKKYEDIRGSIIPEKYIETIAMNYLTDGRYTDSLKEYTEVNKLYLAEQKREEETVHDHDLYMEHLTKLKEYRERRGELWNERQRYNEIKSGDELKSVIDDIRVANEENDKEAKKLYGKIMQNEKRLDAANEAMKKIANAPDDQIAFSEKLPSLLTRRNKLDGIIPLNKFPTLTYNGQTYIVIDETNKEHPRGIKLYDEVQNGKVPIYEFSRTEKDGKYRTTGMKMTHETARVYKEYKNKGAGQGAQLHEATNAHMIQHKSQDMLDELMSKNVRLPARRVTPEDERELTEGEKEVEDMIKKWNQQLRQTNMMRGKKAVIKRIEKEQNKR